MYFSTALNAINGTFNSITACFASANLPPNNDSKYELRTDKIFLCASILVSSMMNFTSACFPFSHMLLRRCNNSANLEGINDNKDQRIYIFFALNTNELN